MRKLILDPRFLPTLLIASSHLSIDCVSALRFTSNDDSLFFKSCILQLKTFCVWFENWNLSKHISLSVCLSWLVEQANGRKRSFYQAKNLSYFKTLSFSAQKLANFFPTLAQLWEDTDWFVRLLWQELTFYPPLSSLWPLSCSHPCKKKLLFSSAFCVQFLATASPIQRKVSRERNLCYWASKRWDLFLLDPKGKWHFLNWKCNWIWAQDSIPGKKQIHPPPAVLLLFSVLHYLRICQDMLNMNLVHTLT